MLAATKNLTRLQPDHNGMAPLSNSRTTEPRPMTLPPQPLEIRYRFTFPDRETIAHVVRPKEEDPPHASSDWTLLGFHQCPNCPLSEKEVKHCPFAQALQAPVSLFGSRPSYTEVEVEVCYRGRIINQTTTLQRAASSLLGAIGATSGCPHTEFLRPMAWFHQPFNDDEETLLRAMSIYLLGQHLRMKRNLPADWSLSGLQSAYRQLRIVNRSLAHRLRTAAEEDSNVNGLVLLDLLASTTISTLEKYEGELDEYFSSYTKANS